MASFPPRELDDAPPTAVAALDRDRFASHGSEDGVLFLCVENAPPARCSTRAEANGSLVFHTTLDGRVLEVNRDFLIMLVDDREVRVRYLLPDGVSLEPLAGRRVTVDLRQSYQGRGRATIDAVFRDASGRQILWAHDGRFPEDRHELSLRATMGAGSAPRLAARTRDGIVSLDAPGLATFRVGGRDLALALVRLGVDDVGFLLLRR